MARGAIALKLNSNEREALKAYAVKNNCPTFAAALRYALPPEIFPNPVREGRPRGYSPKTGKIEQL
jgi:hypothetical protein